MLKTLTDAFRKHDTNQNGVININYEQVCLCVLKLYIMELITIQIYSLQTPIYSKISI